MGWQWTPYLVPLLAGSVISWVLAAVTYGKRHRRGVTALLVILVGNGWWTLTYGLQLAATTVDGKLLWSRLSYLGGTAVPLAALLFAIAYVDWEAEFSERWIAVLAVPSVVWNLVVWLNIELVMQSPRLSQQGSLTLLFWDPTLLWYLLSGYVYLLVFAATTLVAWRAAQSFRIGRFRGQSLSIFLGLCVPLVTDIYGQSQGLRISLTPMALSVTGIMMAIAMFRYELVDIMPIARRTVLEEMDDAVITLDPDDNVVDTNQQARDLFGIDDSPVGLSGGDLFADHPEVVEQFSDVYDVKTEITVELDGERRHFDFKISPVEYSDPNRTGRVIVLRDITALKTRESELSLLKQVFARVLRHNIRNDLNVIMSRAELLANRHSGEDEAMAEEIVARSRGLVETSQKVREAEQVVAGDERLIEHDLSATLDSLLDAFRDQYPGVEFETDVPPDCRVRADSALAVALENLVENAIVHNEHESPRVDITARSTSSCIEVRLDDNGPGIPTSELSVLEAERETALEHGSGVGLWLVNLIVTQSGGDLSFETTGDGTCVRLTLEPALGE